MTHGETWHTHTQTDTHTHKHTCVCMRVVFFACVRARGNMCVEAVRNTHSTQLFLSLICRLQREPTDPKTKAKGDKAQTEINPFNILIQAYAASSLSTGLHSILDSDLAGGGIYNYTIASVITSIKHQLTIQ